MTANDIFQLVINALLTVISGGLGAGAIFGSIELLGRYVAMTSTTKRNLAPLLALVGPPVAYAVMLLLTGEPFQPATLCLAVWTGYMGATRLHDSLKEISDRAERQAVQEGGAA